jgi:hypothetical protein
VKPHRDMKAVKRVGLILCIFWGVLWLASTFVHVWWNSKSGRGFGMGGGRIYVGEGTPGLLPGWGVRWGWSGYYWWIGRTKIPGYTALDISIWMPFLLAIFPTGYVWVRDARAKRLLLDHCVACQYDRHGLPAASPCPECGAAPAPSAQASP